MKPTILQIQQNIFYNTDPSIICEISPDGTILKASNISPLTFQKLTLITNTPSYNNTYFEFIDIEVFLGNDLLPTKIFGIRDIVNARIKTSEGFAFVNSFITHDPFINGFQNRLTIDEIVDILSEISDETPQTKGIPKKYTLIFDPKNAPKGFI